MRTPTIRCRFAPKIDAKELNAKFVESTRKYIQMIAPVATTAEEVKEETPKAKTTAAKKTAPK